MLHMCRAVRCREAFPVQGSAKNLNAFENHLRHVAIAVETGAAPDVLVQYEYVHLLSRRSSAAKKSGPLGRRLEGEPEPLGAGQRDAHRGCAEGLDGANVQVLYIYVNTNPAKCANNLLITYTLLLQNSDSLRHEGTKTAID